MSAPDLDQELVDTVADALLRAGGRHTDADYPLLAAAAIAAVGAYEAAPTAIEAREAWLVEPFAAEPDPQRAAEAAVRVVVDAVTAKADELWHGTMSRRAAGLAVWLGRISAGMVNDPSLKGTVRDRTDP